MESIIYNIYYYTIPLRKGSHYNEGIKHNHSNLKETMFGIKRSTI